MGAEQPQAQQPNQAAQQDKMREFMSRIQSVDEQVGDLARQYPEFAESAKAIKTALKGGMVKVVGSASRGTEAPMPPVAA